MHMPPFFLAWACPWQVAFRLEFAVDGVILILSESIFRFWMGIFLAPFLVVYEPRHGISNNVVCATSKASDQLGICAVWSEPLQVAWIFYDCLATD